MGDFRKFRVWQDSLALTKNVYLLTNQSSFFSDFGLKDHIQRASVSIAANIAEGADRETPRQSAYFFNVAKGSAAEVITLLIIAKDIKYVDDSRFKELENEAEKIRASRSNLIKAYKH